jgi:hypothetical protein
MQIEISEKFMAKLIKLSIEETIVDDMCKNPDVIIDDYAGGNIDDAYYRGADDGEINMAREILSELNKDFS